MSRKAPLIAFQRLEFGYAVAAPGEAYYAPMSSSRRRQSAGGVSLRSRKLFPQANVEAGAPHAAPDCQADPDAALVAYLRQAYGERPSDAALSTSCQATIRPSSNSECQVVILAIEENERPDLKDAMRPAKLEALSDTLDLVIEHAEQARELCEVGDDKPAVLKMHLMQLTTAVKTCLEMLLRP